ncbi:Cytochrome B561 [Candidatus Terasakiella magnetica]|nr:Cytochrome B561 [Candidatus Terasakiella magnetica]
MPNSDSYDSVAKALHWIMAAVIIILWVVGHLIDAIPKGDFRSNIIGMHKAFGVVIAILAVARLTWRSTRPTPALPATMPPMEQFLAKLGHVALYVLMLAIPLDGVLLSQSGGRAVSVFGLVLPTIVEKSDALKSVFKQGHEVMGWMLALLLVAHVAAALRHHIILKDDILRRMMPGRG